jgi:hypothetical protein
MQDRIGDGFTILKLGRTRADVSPLACAIASHGAPVAVLEVPDPVARDVYGFDLLLVRPDLHIVWRGQQPPEDAAEVAAIAMGH